MIRARYSRCGGCGCESEVFYDPRGGHWPSPNDPRGQVLHVRSGTMWTHGACPFCVAPLMAHA